ncbi:MAG TPA: cation-transporting P-type ATPase [Thiobacillus sp.]|nr:cation-transporting P-type ATPase [Thiobacillus sp.]
MHIQSLTAEQSRASLHTSAVGLASAEAQRRPAEFGPNHVEEARPERLLLRVARGFTHFFAIILWVGRRWRCWPNISMPARAWRGWGSPSSASS